MQTRISGKVISKSNQSCTIKISEYENKKNIEMDVYDKNNSSQIGDYVIAVELINPINGKHWKLIQIAQRIKSNGNSTV